MIDLRSDTVTRPTKGMLEAMFKAEVGDDVFGEDPSVRALQDYAAGLFGMEAALFCPSGTMTNQIAIKVHSSAPGELICDELSHVYLYEGGGIAFNSGLSVHLLKGDRGRLNANLVANAINPYDVHKAPTQLVSVENTCNKGGGSIYDMQDLKDIGELCSKHGLKYHLDGARLMNAVVAKNQETKDYGKIFDSISLCLSKGLGAPVGSLLLGNKDFIKGARRIRKLFGGGMRQAGYLAAAGKYALEHQVDRLKVDHDLAKRLSKLLDKPAYISSVLAVETNILVFELDKKVEVNSFLNHLKKHSVLAVPFGGQMVRFVTHLDVQEDAIDTIETALKDF